MAKAALSTALDEPGESLEDVDDAPPLSDEQRAELDRRLDELEEDGLVGITWAQEDLVLAAICRAPVVENTSEESAAFEQGLADIRAGRTLSPEQIQERLAMPTAKP